jgi:magnesium-transporting ATPase (P-type)
MVGQIEQTNYEGPDGNPETKLSLEHQDAFMTILDDVKVLARANSDDKLLMVIGLKNSGKTVAVTGDGINDIEALENSDVGIAMGSGCSAAKQVSSLILADDDFESVIRAVMWGRNIYHNCGRFLQFQMTVNVSVLLLVIVGIITFGEPPMNPVQLLWINLIMDTFAAIALSTEPPMEKILRTPPTSNASILTAPIWRQVMGVSFW